MQTRVRIVTPLFLVGFTASVCPVCACVRECGWLLSSTFHSLLFITFSTLCEEYFCVVFWRTKSSYTLQYQRSDEHAQLQYQAISFLGGLFEWRTKQMYCASLSLSFPPTHNTRFRAARYGFSKYRGSCLRWNCSQAWDSYLKHSFYCRSGDGICIH